MSKAVSVAMPTRRKLIDIPQDVFDLLSLRAAALGTNLKHYIENLLVQEAEDLDDAEVYKYLVRTRPEGKVMASAEEQQDFFNWLESKRK